MRNLVKRGDVWYLQAQVDGRRYLESLQTADQRTAQQRARVKLKAIVEKRWEDLGASRVKQVRCSTVGEVIKAYQEETRLARRPGPDTVAAAVARLRKVVELGADVAAADGALLSVLDGRLCHRFRDAMLAGCPEDERYTRLRSVASSLCQARSVFKPHMVQMYRFRGLNLPDMTEFREYRTEAQPVRWDPPDMTELEKAAVKLREERPELEAVWILAYELGLRAAEIQACRWTWFEEREGSRWVHVCERPDEGWKPKASSGWTPVPVAVWERLRGALVGQEYVIGDLAPTVRENRVQREFSAWMRAHGWTRRECAHELRKVCGDRWAREFGEVIASAWLRHAGVAVTLRHYRDRERFTPVPVKGEGFGVKGGATR